MFDLIISNASVIDGSGREAYRADIAVKGRTIAAIGDLKDSRAERRVDAIARQLDAALDR